MVPKTRLRISANHLNILRRLGRVGARRRPMAVIWSHRSRRKGPTMLSMFRDNVLESAANRDASLAVSGSHQLALPHIAPQGPKAP